MHLYSAFSESDSPQSARVWHMLTRDHTVLPAAHKRNEPVLPLLCKEWSGVEWSGMEWNGMEWNNAT